MASFSILNCLYKWLCVLAILSVDVGATNAALSGACGEQKQQTIILDWDNGGIVALEYDPQNGSTTPPPVLFNRNNCNGNRTVGPVTAECIDSKLVLKIVLSEEMDGASIIISHLGKITKIPIKITRGVVVPPQFLAATVSERGVGADECVLSVRWSEAVISCGGSVSQYVLSVTPPTSDCPSGQCVNTTDTQYDLTVTLDQAYNLTVRAVDSCGNNGTSDLVQIVLHETQTCSTTDIQYDSSSGVLVAVTIMWDGFVLLVDGVSVENITYSVSLAADDLYQTDALTYTFSVPDNVIAEYSAVVKANVPCASEVQCSSQIIFTEEYDFCEGISVGETDPAKATIICTLLTPLPVAWQCTARCGLSPRLGDLNINVSSSAGSGDQNTTIELPSLMERTTYHCIVSATRSNDGTTLCRERLQFTTTGCLPSDLLQSRGPDYQTSVNGECTEFGICTEDVKKCVVYNGTSEGSIAVYNSTTDYCLTETVERICDGEEWSGKEPIIEEVTMETKLEEWNIALIAIGVTAYIIGMCVATVLGTSLFLRANSLSDGVLAVVVLIASGLLFPLAAVLYFVMKKKKLDEKRLDLKIWYKILMGASVVITIICFIMWLVLIGYTPSHDFYDEGYRRGDNSECVPDGNEAEKRVRNGLVIACFLLSLLVLPVWSVCAALWRCGVVDSSDSSDGSSNRRRRMSSSMTTFRERIRKLFLTPTTQTTPTLPQTEEEVRNML